MGWRTRMLAPSSVENEAKNAARHKLHFKQDIVRPLSVGWNLTGAISSWHFHHQLQPLKGSPCFLTNNDRFEAKKISAKISCNFSLRWIFTRRVQSEKNCWSCRKLTPRIYFWLFCWWLNYLSSLLLERWSCNCVDQKIRVGGLRDRILVPTRNIYQEIVWFLNNVQHEYLKV